MKFKYLILFLLIRGVLWLISLEIIALAFLIGCLRDSIIIELLTSLAAIMIVAYFLNIMDAMKKFLTLARWKKIPRNKLLIIRGLGKDCYFLWTPYIYYIYSEVGCGGKFDRFSTEQGKLHKKSMLFSIFALNNFINTMKWKQHFSINEYAPFSFLTHPNKDLRDLAKRLLN